jgi:hypothetical protein
MIETHGLVKLDGVTKVFTTEEVETHGIHAVKVHVRTGPDPGQHGVSAGPSAIRIH